ncbi:LipA and NB-ARC domain-containing protein [Colletotrichum higginsianum IMI 349063]|uniref:LipA and NB-ARC domain-containing protein n=1 Tax=Colletotrichum higginsianum (strain IMI 349063) TaxID=759273 RepID=A0A1B7XU29_COLHI|nr:LipA and NB-ARC domain-containing protein [Colletotrichum higginsianum IMI 349063]OBR03258.1 LipA and NB-ARC domain-containing protein [Colletotrichum higginsianum IMI 349063]
MLTRFSAKDRSGDDEDGGSGGSAGEARYSTKGTYGLKKCHDAEDAVADIVFVHGLTGNRETTWTDKSTGVFWPAHLLKDEVPRTRIVTFGYDADVVHFWAAASQNRVRNHAVNLINAISQLRERTDTEDRPVIFVVHSLGGLIFEDAMLASRNSAEAHIRSVYDSTAGVCFMGTPHCGSTLAGWATVFGQIATVVKKTNTSILKVLEPESEVLALIQGDFHTMLRNRADQGRPPLKMTCFYEELPVKGAGEIVPKHSAILPAYNSIGIHKNHMDMTKFSSAEDPGYLSVSTEILRWVRAIQKAQRSAAAAPTASSQTMPSPGLGAPASSQGATGAYLPPGNSHLPLGYGSNAQWYPSGASYSQGDTVISGSINNHGNGKFVTGNTFQGPTSF